jgi:hypothetical protein
MTTPKTDNAWNDLEALLATYGKNAYMPHFPAMGVAYAIAAHPSMVKVVESYMAGRPTVRVEVNEIWAEALGSDVVYFQPTGDGAYAAEC